MIIDAAIVTLDHNSSCTQILCAVSQSWYTFYIEMVLTRNIYNT